MTPERLKEIADIVTALGKEFHQEAHDVYKATGSPASNDYFLTSYSFALMVVGAAMQEPNGHAQLMNMFKDAVFQKLTTIMKAYDMGREDGGKDAAH